ncbi:hypothetical protein BH23ACT9_BH23ACT9_35370 [soil metagenome]
MARSRSVGAVLLDAVRQLLRSRTSTSPTRAPGRTTGRTIPLGEVDTPEGRVTLSYGPAANGSADPGEVVWAWVPYEDDPSQGKDRPLLVIGHLGRDAAALALTTKPHDDRRHHPIGPGPWDREGRPSWVKLDRVIRLAPRGIRREGAVVDKVSFGAVVRAWRDY